MNNKNIKVKKIVLIGLDGMIPELMLKFCEEGTLPNIGRLMKKGVFSKMLPAPQVDTPTNWTTIATGAWPETHGINSFGFHIEGDSFNRVYDMTKNLFPAICNINTKYYMNKLCKAEYLWQSAERAGKRVLLVNFPGCWPPNIRKGIVVDGTGPHSSPISRLSNHDRFSSRENDGIRLRVVKGFGWKNIPYSHMPALESCIDVSGEHFYNFDNNGWVAYKVMKEVPSSKPIRYFLLILARSNNYYDTVVISRNKDVSSNIGFLSLGQNTDWITEKFSATIGEKIYANMIVREEFNTKIEGVLKLKLTDLAPDGKVITIDRTPIFNLNGWAFPSCIAGELIDDLLSTETFDKKGRKEEKQYISRKSPLCQVYETVPDMAEGVVKTCSVLTRKYPWDMLFTQIHAPDGVHHDELNSICQSSPTYDPVKAPKSWKRIKEIYQILDKTVGEIIKNCVDKNTLIVVLSDHGAIPTKKRVMIEFFLKNQGLITYKKNQKGRLVIDLTKSKVISGINYVTQNIWINLKGRDPSGVVDPSEYEKLRSKVIEILISITDPESGERPINLALRKEDARVIGQGGDRVGDVIYFFKEGYTNKFANGITGIDPANIPETGFESVLRGPEFGRHHSYLPTANYCGCSVQAVFVMTGPGIRKNYRRPYPIRTVDVAPTIAFLAHIPYPLQCEGMVIGDFLA